MMIRTVDASHGWRWLAAGILIFRKNPRLWLLLIATLFIGSRILLAVPLIGVIAVLLAPNFMAGLAHGAQAVETGKPLRFGYLASGFLKGARPLLTVGAIWLIGQILTLLAMVTVGGEAFMSVSKAIVSGATSPEAVAAVSAGAPSMALALLTGLVLSVPLIMAVWFAPLLVFFDDVKAPRALALSLWACAKNILPFLIYGVLILVPVVFLTPLSVAARDPALALWLLAPIVVPSIYVSYKDLFVSPPATTPVSAG